MRVLAIVALTLSLSTVAPVESRPEAGPHPEAPPETSQFAFLVGAWDCATRSLKPDGSGFIEGRARWTGHWILGGWALQDDWESTGPGGAVFRGTNVRSFNPRTGKWDNRWLSSGDLRWKYFEAEKVGDTAVMTGGEGSDPAGREFVDRNVFHGVRPDSWKWRKDRSFDGGETWLEGVAFIEARRGEEARDGAPGPPE